MKAGLELLFILPYSSFSSNYIVLLNQTAFLEALYVEH
jgi:hypothetical protein